MPGFTMLEAVNAVCTQLGLPPSTALDGSGATGSSSQGQAQHHIEYQTRLLLGEGHACNLAECKKYTLASTGQITLASSVVRIKPTGPNQRRNWVQRGSLVYNAEADTDQFPAGDYFFDVWSTLPFTDVEQSTQAAIIANAARAYQQQLINDARRDAQIAENQAKAQLGIPRIPPVMQGATPFNRPMVPNSTPQ